MNTSINISDKVKQIEPSKTLAISAKAKKLKAKGKDIIDFSIGEPDFDTPDYIKKGAIEGLERGYTRYTPVAGLDILREEVAKKFTNENNIMSLADNILISPGGKFSIYAALISILNPGDEVLIPAPFWTSYPEMVKLADGKPIIVETSENYGNKINIDLLNKYLTEKTKMLILTNPSNPTGIIYDRSLLEKIAKWACENNIYILSDELYDKLVYGQEHVSIASLNDDVYKRTITINGMSKAYAMTGWRIGFANGPIGIIKKMTSAQSHITSNATSISQYASYIALRDREKNKGILTNMYKQFEKRKNRIVDILDKEKRLTYIKPEGAFYIMINVSSYFGLSHKGKIVEDANSLSEILLDEKYVAITPGEAFGNKNYLRMSYANSIENIEEGLKRILDLLRELK